MNVNNRKAQTSSDPRNFYGTGDGADTVKVKTIYYDDNHVDTAKIRNAEAHTDSRDFYAHGLDPSKTMVKNVYDSTAVQNTIGTRGKVMIDDTIDQTDMVYSNDRNYGKTGWNGQFTYETPQPKKSTQ